MEPLKVEIFDGWMLENTWPVLNLSWYEVKWQSFDQFVVEFLGIWPAPVGEGGGGVCSLNLVNIGKGKWPPLEHKTQLIEFWLEIRERQKK